jgi:hypothetical protein
MCSSLVEITWEKPGTGRAQKEIAVIEDFAPTGAGLLMGVRVEKHLRVTIAGDGRSFHGVVTDCRLDPGGYLVDVSFPAAENPAADQHRPKHCLDISRLDASSAE